jgi:hypothetical protein
MELRDEFAVLKAARIKWPSLLISASGIFPYCGSTVLLGSRYCEMDRLSDEAWHPFGHTRCVGRESRLSRRTRRRSGYTKEKTAKRLSYSQRSMTTASF